MSAGGDDEPVVIVPVDLEVEDRIIGPITFRLAGWLATAGAGVALTALCWPNIPATVLGVLVALTGLAGGFARPRQRPLAWWTRPVAAYLHRARRRRYPRTWTAGAAFLGIRQRPWKHAAKHSTQPSEADAPAKPTVPTPTAAPFATPAEAPASAPPTASEGLPRPARPARIAGSQRARHIPGAHW